MVAPIPKISGVTGEIGSPEQALWRAVLYVAVRDALGFVYGVAGDKYVAEKRRHVKRAVTFFNEDVTGLGLICDAASMDFERVRNAMSQVILSRWGYDPKSAVDAEPAEQLTRGYLARTFTKRPDCHPLIRAVVGYPDVLY